MFDLLIFTGHQSALGMDSPWYGILQRYLGSPRSRIRGGIVLEIADSTRIIEILRTKDIFHLFFHFETQNSHSVQFLSHDKLPFSGNPSCYIWRRVPWCGFCYHTRIINPLGFLESQQCAPHRHRTTLSRHLARSLGDDAWKDQCCQVGVCDRYEDQRAPNRRRVLSDSDGHLCVCG